MKLVGEKIYLRFMEVSNAEEALELHLRNREFFQSFSPLRSKEFYTLEKQADIIKENAFYMEKGERYSFGIFLKNNNKLIGNVALMKFIDEEFENYNIGYYLDRAHNGSGYMTEAVKLAVDFAANELKLQRIAAGVMPVNIPSARILEKAGFQRDGTRMKSVMINGKWEEHQVFTILLNGSKG